MPAASLLQRQCQDFIEALNDAAGVFDKTGAQQSGVEKLAGDEFGGIQPFVAGPGEFDDERMLWIDVEVYLRWRRFLLHRFHHGAQLWPHARTLRQKGGDGTVHESFR